MNVQTHDIYSLATRLTLSFFRNPFECLTFCVTTQCRCHKIVLASLTKGTASVGTRKKEKDEEKNRNQKIYIGKWDSRVAQKCLGTF